MLIRAGLLLLVLAAVIVALPAAGRQLGHWLAAESEYLEPNAQADAIVVLGGNTIRRMQDALSLYQAGVAAQMALTGLNPEESVAGYDEILLARDMALDAGVPESQFTLLATTSTSEDAQAIAFYVQDNRLTTVVIVSDWTHARRALCTIHASVGSNVVLTFSPSSVPFAPDNWWTVERGLVAVTNELLKMIFYTARYGVFMFGCFASDSNPALILTALLVSILLSAVSVYLIRVRPSWFGSVDVPNERSSHSTPTPRGGGLGVLLTCLVLWTLLAIFGLFQSAQAFVIVAAVTGAVVAFVGWRDDRSSLSAKVRLGIYAVACAVAVAFTAVFYRLALPLLGVIELGWAAAFLLTFVWVLGFLNIFNFMDGIDGLAGGQAAIAAGFWASILLLNGQLELAVFALIVSGATLGFLWHNNPPAKIFMGDVGSAFLGFTLAIIPVMAYGLSGDAKYPVVGVMLVAPFVLDGASTIIRRALKRENILKPHRTHLYQRLVITGLTHQTVTGHYRLLMIASGLCAVLYMFGSDGWMLLAGALTVGMFVLYARQAKQLNTLSR